MIGREGPPPCFDEHLLFAEKASVLHLTHDLRGNFARYCTLRKTAHETAYMLPSWDTPDLRVYFGGLFCTVIKQKVFEQ